jgi:hypothetical protein
MVVKIPKNTKVIFLKIHKSIKVRKTTNNCISWAWRMNKKRAKQADIIFAIVDREIIDIFRIYSIRLINGSHRKRIVAQQITDAKLINKYVKKTIPDEFNWRNPVTYNYSL